MFGGEALTVDSRPEGAAQWQRADARVGVASDAGQVGYRSGGERVGGEALTVDSRPVVRRGPLSGRQRADARVCAW